MMRPILPNLDFQPYRPKTVCHLFDEMLMASAGSKGYQIPYSLLFDGAAHYLSRTPAGAGNRKTWSFSCWFRRAALYGSANQMILSADTGGASDQHRVSLRFVSGDLLQVSGQTNVWFTSTPVYRDVGKWYHLLLVVDMTQATASDRIKLYINGALVAGTYGGSIPAQNTDLAVNGANAHAIGAYTGTGQYFHGMIAEPILASGVVLTPADVLKFNQATGAWEPKSYTPPIATNNFRLRFRDATSTTTLGADDSGNGNDWTLNSMATSDRLNDGPIDCHAVLSAIDPGPGYNSGITLSEGGLVAQAASSAGSFASKRATIATKTGLFYFEMTNNNNNGTGEWWNFGLGATSVAYPTSGRWKNMTSATQQVVIGSDETIAGGNGNAAGTVMMCAANLTTGNVWFGRNGVWHNSGDPAAGTNPTVTGLAAEYWAPVLTTYQSTPNVTFNFGQKPFAYTPPAGFKALCTANLPTPSVARVGLGFEAKLYTGNGTSQTITADELDQIDLAWLKARSAANSGRILDTSRGGALALVPSSTNAEVNDTSGTTGISGNTLPILTDGSYNQNAVTYVAWFWKKAAAYGFDIVAYNGTGVAKTEAHGLGKVPSFIIHKSRNTAATNWPCYHASIGNTGAIYLNSTSGISTSAVWFNNTSPTSSVWTVGTDGNINGNTRTYIAYLWAAIDGFSAFPKHTGNGSADGTFVWGGIRVLFDLVKNISTGVEQWMMLDAVRSPSNPSELGLFPNSSGVEISASNNAIDFLSGGLKLRGTGATTNTNTSTYIHMMFGSPFKYANAA